MGDKTSSIKNFFDDVKTEMSTKKDLELKVVTDNYLPKYNSEASAGLDLYCSNEDDVTIRPDTVEKIPTGVKVEIPTGYFGAVYPRSSTGVKLHLSLANTVGIIDEDYRGEIKLFMYNYGDEDIVVKNGDRLCQLVIQPYIRVNVVKVNKLSDTKRGEGGFGSTGK